MDESIPEVRYSGAADRTRVLVCVPALKEAFVKAAFFQAGDAFLVEAVDLSGQGAGSI
jgi:hypothetical protein